MDKKCIVEVFSRVTGYWQPVQMWNKGKEQEFHDRKTYKLECDKARSTKDKI